MAETIRFKRPARPDIPVLALSESGSEMLLWTIFSGPIEYDRADSESLAGQLEAAAKMVREHA